MIEKHRILVVEDEGIIAMSLQAKLIEMGYDVPCTASSAEEGIELVAQIRPDLVLMDIMLGEGIDGIDGARQIRDRFGIPVVFLSAYSDDETLQRAKLTEPYGYMLKPVTDRELRIVTEVALYKHKTERALKLSEDKHRIVVETANDAILSTDSDGRISYLNQTSEFMFGYSRAELCGLPLMILLPERCRNSEWLELEHFFSKQESTTLGPLEIAGMRKDGVEFPMELSIAKWKAGNDTHFTAIIRDITKRKQAEEAFRNSEKRYHRLVELSPDAILVHRENKIVFVNRACLLLLGADSQDQILGKSPLDFLDYEYHSMVKERIAALLRREPKPAAPYEIKIVDLGGKSINVEIVSTLLDDDGVPSIQVIVRDISERIHLSNQLRQAQKMEAVGQLAGGIAHDFNNLLTVIIGRAELVMDHLEAESVPYKSVELILKTGLRAATLTHQLLAFSRRQILQPKVLNLNSVVTDMDTMLRRLIREDIQVTTFLDPVLMSTKADPGQIEQVLMNLVVNARDAMPKGGTLIIETANEILDEAYCRDHAGAKPGAYVMLAVSDSGIGMSEETKSHIFEPFFTTKPLGQGTGLGLATVFGIINQSGGHIQVYSELGKGSVFKAYLPQSGVPAASTSSQFLPAIQNGHETVLVVEDEEHVRNLTSEILDLQGYTVMPSACGADALSICLEQNSKIDLMITDAVMPGISGVDLAAEVRNLYPKIKVLLMSGYTDHPFGEMGLPEGIHFIQKPFSPHKLANKVRMILDGEEQ